jgi:hypothetical protein
MPPNIGPAAAQMIVPERNAAFGGETRDMASARCRRSPREALRSRGAPEPPPHNGVLSPGDAEPTMPARTTAH